MYFYLHKKICLYSINVNMDRSVTVPIGVTHKDFVFLEKTITLSEQYGRWMVLHPNGKIEDKSTA